MVSFGGHGEGKQEKEKSNEIVLIKKITMSKT